ARVQPGESVVVLGCGGVALNVIQAARLAGASPIVTMDANAAALQRAQAFGATHAVQVDASDMELTSGVAAVVTLTNGRGADYAFEATRVPALACDPLRLVRDGGTALQVSGINEAV